MPEIEALLDEIIDNERVDVIEVLSHFKSEYPDAYEFLKEKVSEII